MSGITVQGILGKLNSVGYKNIESAMPFAKLRGNPEVEFVHWIIQIVQSQDSDLHHIIKHFDIDVSKLAKELTESLDKLPRGSSTLTGFDELFMKTLKDAWNFASLKFKSPQTRIGHVFLSAVQDSKTQPYLVSIANEFSKIKAADLANNFEDITAGSPEVGLSPQDGTGIGAGAGAHPGEASGAIAPAAMGKEEALQQFCKDLTELARTGAIDQIVGRDEEIRQLIDILMRRRQNNPILTGEAGVGKTAVVEGFALRIAKGDVPPMLQGARLLELDVAALQAGASMKGEFENRLKQVIEEVQSSTTPIIMFIDETHTLVGAGGAAGTGDAANLLKPALARGELRTIGATTWAEYKKHIEKDPALTRRFQVVKVDEPGLDKAVLMMRGIVGMLEKHHKVQVLDEAIEAAVHLSARYIPARQLPDKSVSLIDTACARVGISQHATPAQVEDSQKRIGALETELGIIGREKTAGYDVGDREGAAQEKLEAEKQRLEGLTARWQQEKAIVDDILSIRAKLRGDGGTVDGEDAAEVPEGSDMSEEERAALLADLKTKDAELQEVQGENPLILPIVDEQAVASVVGDWTGIPVGRMVKDEINTVLNLADALKKRVIGQDHAMEMIAKRVQTARAGLDNPSKPIGVFMLAGTSGVGKTETAIAIAETLYGGEANMITINMSEFQESHTVSTLKGAPPGYVGYGEGGILTEAVRRKPYSVVLLDEVEKAHSDVHEIFFQVFDKGVMEDGEGRMIDFKNTLILLTSNAGSDLIMDMCKDPDLMPEPDGIAKALREPLLKVFPAALLGRIVTIPYFPLSPDMIGEITKLQLNRVVKRVQQSHGVPFTYDDKVVDLIVSRCQEVESGGRMIDAVLTNNLLPAVSGEFLRKMMAGQDVKSVNVSTDGDEFTYVFG